MASTFLNICRIDKAASSDRYTYFLAARILGVQFFFILGLIKKYSVFLVVLSSNEEKHSIFETNV